jgi:hypothetical protein
MVEISQIAKADDPMLYVERREYLTALRQVLNGVEGARVTLAKARQRLDGAGRKGRP